MVKIYSKYSKLDNPKPYFKYTSMDIQELIQLKLQALQLAIESKKVDTSFDTIKQYYDWILAELLK